MILINRNDCDRDDSDRRDFDRSELFRSVEIITIHRDENIPIEVIPVIKNLDRYYCDRSKSFRSESFGPIKIISTDWNANQNHSKRAILSQSVLFRPNEIIQIGIFPTDCNHADRNHSNCMKETRSELFWLIEIMAIGIISTDRNHFDQSKLLALPRG